MSVPKENGKLDENCNVNNVENYNNEKECEENDNIKEQEVRDIIDKNKQKQPVDSDGNGPYVPGSLTDPDKRHDSYDLLVKKAIEDVHGPQENQTDRFWKKVAENAKVSEYANDIQDMRSDKKRKDALKLPSVNVSQNFQFARKMHCGNLEHQPLPDTLGYRNLTKIAEHRDSDINVKPYAIGWKGYGASGPTCCTKMRVHRPKTCDAKKSDPEGIETKKRPSTSAPFAKPMTHMDLAICWDFRPHDPSQEPKPPKHIDGSNGSKAPAVFTMVHTPKEDSEDLIKTGHSNPIFNQNRLGEDLGHHPVPYFEKDMTKEKRNDSCDVQYCPQHNEKKNTPKKPNSNTSSRKNSITAKPQCDGVNGCGTPSEMSRKCSEDFRPDHLEPIKEAWKNKNNKETYDTNGNRNSIDSYDKTPLAQGKLHQSSSNGSQISKSTKDSIASNNNNKHKTCISCNGISKPIIEEKPKENFKLAFKAGNPNSVHSSNSSQDCKNFKIPKMRPPYTKKSYSIPTLAPPFSIWRDANSNGYPEHWRLASVYQHAYKPPEQRRKTLISSVYQ